MKSTRVITKISSPGLVGCGSKVQSTRHAVSAFDWFEPTGKYRTALVVVRWTTLDPAASNGSNKSGIQ